MNWEDFSVKHDANWFHSYLGGGNVDLHADKHGMTFSLVPARKKEKEKIIILRGLQGSCSQNIRTAKFPFMFTLIVLILQRKVSLYLTTYKRDSRFSALIWFMKDENLWSGYAEFYGTDSRHFLPHLCERLVQKKSPLLEIAAFLPPTN